MKRTFRRSVLCILISGLLLFPPASAVFPPNNASWTIHRGVPENQGINPNCTSPVTDHELWNNTTISDYTCDPVVANVTTSLFGPVKENLVYVGHVNRIDVFDAWNGTLEYYLDDVTLGEVNQIIVDDPFVLIKTPSELRAYNTRLANIYWSYTDVAYQWGVHANETIGHFTNGLNRIQLVQHQVIAGVVNGSDSNYTIDPNYAGHRAFRADYDSTILAGRWHRNLVEEVWGTPAIYLNNSLASEWGGNNTTVGAGHGISGYGQELPIDPDGIPMDVLNKNVIYLTRDNWLYCLRADDGKYSIIQEGTATNASYTNPRYIGDDNDTVDTWTSPLVAYHIKVYGNNSWGGGDGTWQGGQPIGCDAVFFITGDGYANGICLYDGAGLYAGLYTWAELAFNFTDIPGGVTFYQSFTIDEVNNPYDDNPTFIESYLYVGDVWGLFSQIQVSDGGIFAIRNMSLTSWWSFCVDSPIFNTGRVYTLMHNITTGMLKIQVFRSGLTTVWTRTYDLLSNTSGFWNPEPALAFDTIFVTAHDDGILDIWAQRDNEPPWVDSGETVIYPVIGQQFNFTNASAGDPDGYIANYTWDLEWGYRYTLICNFTFWVHQSTTGYLNVTDDDGATASDSFTIVPQLPTSPVANITWDGWAIVGINETFNGSLSTGTNLTWYNWTVTGPGAGVPWYDNGTNQTISFNFTEVNQTYNVTLNVTDEWNQSDEMTVPVFVNAGQSFNVTWNNRPLQGYLGDSLRYNFTIDHGNVTNVTWLWGDGSTTETSGSGSNSSEARHQWGRWGSYDVTVIITNDDGVTVTETFTVEIGLIDLSPLFNWLWWLLFILVAILLMRFFWKYFTRESDDFVDV